MKEAAYGVPGLCPSLRGGKRVKRKTASPTPAYRSVMMCRTAFGWWRVTPLLALASVAHAQIVYAPTAAGPFVALDKAIVSGRIHVETQQKTGAPWVFTPDWRAPNTESACPCVLASETGDVADGNLWNTATVADGKHVVTASSASIAQPLTATFTVDNVPDVPVPPVTPPPTPGLGSITLTWTPPTQNTDGSTLTDLAGFIVSWVGASAGAVTITNPGISRYVIDKLPPGTYFVDVLAFNTAFGQSQPSNEVSATVAGTPPPPTPVNCTVSAWMSGTPSGWLPQVCATGTQTQTTPQTRVVVIPASNDGAACPALTQTLTETRSCTVPTPASWVVAPVSGNSRPVYEAVLNAAGTALVRGNSEGFIASGKTCGEEVFRISTNSYRAITESDAMLASPTYKGRQHVAICVKP